MKDYGRDQVILVLITLLISLWETNSLEGSPQRNITSS